MMTAYWTILGIGLVSIVAALALGLYFKRQDKKTGRHAHGH